MSASIIKRGAGRYAVIVEVGRHPARRCRSCNKRVWVSEHEGNECPSCRGELATATDCRRQRWHGPYSTLKEAKEARAELAESLRTDSYVAPAALTLGKYLQDQWLPAMSLRPSTLDSYRSMIERHILPTLGSVRLQNVDAPRLNALYRELAPGESDRKGLSPKSIRNVHVVLHKALGDAVKWNMIVRNPAAYADPPRGRRTEMSYWTPEQVRSFLVSLGEHRLTPAFLLAASTGMRRGELLGLRWSDVDLGEQKLTIRRSLVTVNYKLHLSEPKTDRGRRTIAIDSGTADALRRHRKGLAEERLAMGDGYLGEDLVFPRADGRPLHPDFFSQAFDRLVKKSGLPRIRLHDLRHSHVAHLIEAGAHVGVISQRLGHASVSFTLDQYGHLMRGLDERAAELVGARLTGPRGS